VTVESELMMQPKTILISLMLGCLIGPLAAIPALAIPPLPSSFYGTVQVGGKNVPDHTVVQALTDGQAYGQGRTQTHEGISVYHLDVLGDDTDTAARDGGREGDTIQFEIGGVLAEQTGTWHSGTNVELNLTGSGFDSPATPPPTPSPVPTQTPISPGQTAKDEPGGLGLSAVVALVAVVVVAGGVAAWAMLRKR
jgi:hypothetical protein